MNIHYICTTLIYHLCTIFAHFHYFCHLSKVSRQISKIFLAEVCEIIRRKIVFLGNLPHGEVGGLEVHKHMNLTLGVEPFATWHAEGTLKPSVECGGGHFHLCAQLLCVNLERVEMEHLLAKLEIVAMHTSEHIEQFLLII